MTQAEALAAIDRLVGGGGDADDVLCRVVDALREHGGYTWAGIFFTEDDELVLGPEAGVPAGEPHARVPVVWHGVRVAELAVDGAPPEDAAFLERVAVLVSGHCLVGWDTGGEPWEP